ncbi:hypothetical protein V8E36_005246 [Tilletia maclaganii]
MMLSISRLFTITLSLGMVAAYDQLLAKNCQVKAVDDCKDAPNPAQAHGLEAWYKWCRCNAWSNGQKNYNACHANCVADLKGGDDPYSEPDAKSACNVLCDARHCVQPPACNA